LDASGRAAKKREEIAHTLGTVALRDFDPANDRLVSKPVML
jgi:hypothetical protein